VGGEIFRTCPKLSWGPTNLLYNGYRVFPGGKERPGRDADPSPLLVPWSRNSRAIPIFPLWAVRPVQSLGACTRVHFTFVYCILLSSNRYEGIIVGLFLISNFRRVLNDGFFRLGDFPESDFNVPTFRHTFIFLLTLPMMMEQSVPKRRHIQFRRRRITQNKE